MKNSVFFEISLRIIILFCVVMAATFIPEHLRIFFGDELHDCSIRCIDSCINRYDSFDEAWNWGVRHYWYFWMMLILFLLSVINVGMSIFNVVTKRYDL